MKVTAYDFETTGVDPRTCEPVQVAFKIVDVGDHGTITEEYAQSFYLRFQADECPEGAYRVHGITKALTEEQGVYPHGLLDGMTGRFLGYNNHAYDDILGRRYGMVIEDSIDLFLATRRFKSQGLLSKASLSVAYQELTGNEPSNAHDALGDVNMTLALIAPIMEKLELNTMAQLCEWLSLPWASTQMKMPFGKHKGVRLENLPRGYIAWAKDNLTLTGDLAASFKLL